MTLTIVILTHNSEETIKQALKSSLFANEIIVIDDNSTDLTLKIIEKITLKNSKITTYNHFLHNNFAAQRNWAMSKTNGKWIFFLDADEVINKKLQNEITKVTNEVATETQGFFVNRTDHIFKQQLKHGETSNIKLLRLAKKGSGTWNYSVHENWEIKGEIKELKNRLTHIRNITIAEFLKRIDWYSTIKSEELYKNKTKESKIRLVTNPIGKFLANYIFKRGFLDGFPGLCMALMMSWHSLLVRVKLQILWLNNGKSTFKLK